MVVVVVVASQKPFGAENRSCRSLGPRWRGFPACVFEAKRRIEELEQKLMEVRPMKKLLKKPQKRLKTGLKKALKG